MKNPNRITRSDVLVLRNVIDEAEVWRGSMVGNPDPVPLQQFDAFIARARQALERVRLAHIQQRELEKQ